MIIGSMEAKQRINHPDLYDFKELYEGCKYIIDEAIDITDKERDVMLRVGMTNTLANAFMNIKPLATYIALIGKDLTGDKEKLLISKEDLCNVIFQQVKQMSNIKLNIIDSLLEEEGLC